MNDPKIKQQIVEKIKASTNILVTVSNSPSVDALSAALALTLILNKLGKHSTAIFSGAIPPAITFLDPGKVFEASTDSLRDFIIALDKEKADHLRYKVEGDMVKIFITPYRTTITGDDLEFSQGDYNVELVLALGVENQSHLDSALEAHGRILHDATVATLSAGTQTSSLGSLDWHEDEASSLSEMLVSLVEAFKTDKDQKPLLDQQTATAILTGIVAETDRFSNTKTSSKVMTVAAQLMAAGADQQLIASKLQEAHTIGQPAQVASDSIKIDKTPIVEPAPLQGAIDLSHSTGETLEDIANKVKQENQQEAAEAATDLLNEQTAPTVVAPPVITPPVEPVLPPIQVTNAYAIETEPVVAPVTEPAPASVAPVITPITPPVVEPAPAAPIDASVISSHAYLGASVDTTGGTPAESIDIFANNGPEVPGAGDALHSAYAPEISLTPPTLEAPADDTLSGRDASSRDDALAAVHATFEAPSAPVAPSFNPAPGVVLPAPPPLPDFSAMAPPPIANAYAPEPLAGQPERLGDIFAPEPVTPTQPVTNDPAQFKIPGQ